MNTEDKECPSCGNRLVREEWVSHTTYQCHFCGTGYSSDLIEDPVDNPSGVLYNEGP